LAQVFIPDWILIVQEMKTGGETWHFSASYKQAASGTRYTGAQLQALASQWYTSVITSLKPIITTGTTFVKTTARDMTDDTGAEGIYVQPAGETGAATGDFEPLSVCGTVSTRSAIVGRSGRGRAYISGFPETGTANGVLNSTVVGQLAVVGSAIRLFVGSVDIVCSSVIASKKHVALRAMLSTVVTNQINVQSRRLPGHRRHKKPLTPTPS